MGVRKTKEDNTMSDALNIQKSYDIGPGGPADSWILKFNSSSNYNLYIERTNCNSVVRFTQPYKTTTS